MNTAPEIRDSILVLLKERNISANKMLLECGFNTSLINDMKRGQTPSADKIAVIAKYLGVSADFLMGNHDENDFDAEEDFIVALRKILNGTSSRKISEADKKHLLDFAEMLARIRASSENL